MNFDFHGPVAGSIPALASLASGVGYNGNLVVIGLGKADGIPYLMSQDRTSGAWTYSGQLISGGTQPPALVSLITVRGKASSLLVIGLGRDDGLPYAMWQDSSTGAWTFYGKLVGNCPALSSLAAGAGHGGNTIVAGTQTSDGSVRIIWQDHYTGNWIFVDPQTFPGFPRNLKLAAISDQSGAFVLHGTQPSPPGAATGWIDGAGGAWNAAAVQTGFNYANPLDVVLANDYQNRALVVQTVVPATNDAGSTYIKHWANNAWNDEGVLAGTIFGCVTAYNDQFGNTRVVGVLTSTRPAAKGAPPSLTGTETPNRLYSWRQDAITGAWVYEGALVDGASTDIASGANLTTGARTIVSGMGARNNVQVIALGVDGQPNLFSENPSLPGSSLPEYIVFGDKQDDGKTVTLREIQLDLNAGNVDSSKNLVVYADEVAIVGTIALPGKSVALYARRVISLNGTIDTSGSPGANASTNRATDGRSAGDSGDGGAGGGAGGNAGSITILAERVMGSLVLLGDGGTGGTGQPGGNGAVGHAGVNCVADSIQRDGFGGSRVHPGHGATNGQDGGSGGPGGTGGAGGIGATLNVKTTRAGSLLAFSCALGSGGAGGQGGTGATGGTGGTGGCTHYLTWHLEQGGQPNQKYVVIDTQGLYGAGSNGHLGGAGGTQAGTNGSAGSFASTTLTYSQLREAADINWIDQLLLTLRQAELYYLDGYYGLAKDLLNWLWNISPTSADVQPPGNTNLQWADWCNLHDRAATLLRQLSLGLSYYGNPANWVPLTSFEEYDTLLTSMFVTVGQIDTAFTTYSSSATSEADRRTNLKNAMDQSQAAIGQLQIALATLTTPKTGLIDQSQNLIGTLTTALTSKQTLVTSTVQDFLTAALAQIQKTYPVTCNMSALVDSVKDIYGIYSSNGTNVGDWQKLIKDVPDAFTDPNAGKRTSIISKLEVAEDDLKDLLVAIQNLATDPDADAGKVMMDKTKLDKALQPFSDLAKQYKVDAVIDDYLNLVQTRNEKVFTYNKQLADAGRLQARINLLQSNYTRTQANYSDTIDPTVVEFSAFMTQLEGQVLDELTQMVYEFNEAYSYLSLLPRPFTMQNQTLPALDKIFGDIEAGVKAFINNGGDLNEPFDLTSPGSRLMVPVNSSQQQQHIVDFTIPLIPDAPVPTHTGGTLVEHSVETYSSLFDGLFRALASSFTLDVTGASTTSGILTAYLTHSGRATLQDEKKKIWVFSHEPVTSIYKINLETGAVLAGGALGGGVENPQRIGLTPFTTWTLQFPIEDNPGLNLTGMTQVLVGFSGLSLTKTTPRVKSNRT